MDIQITEFNLSDNMIPVIKVEVGLKVKVRDTVLKQLQEEKYIQDNFKLNILRLNRWWYSVYFDKKSEIKNAEI